MLNSAALDVVSVTTPNRWHAPFTLQALEHGIHTLCTKPVARTLDEARTMLATARRVDRTLMVGHQRPYTTAARHLKRMIDVGELGDIYHADLTYLRRKSEISPSFLDVTVSGGGPLIDLGIHLIDLALWLVGTPRPLRATGIAQRRLLHLRRPESTVEDYISALVTFAGGLSMSISTCYEANVPDSGHSRRVALYGTKLGAAFDPWSGRFVYGDLQGTREETVAEAEPKDNQQQYSVDAFVTGVLSGDRRWDTVARGIVALELVQAIYRSAERGGISVDLGPDVAG
jgi:predicted dehydrogenase